MPTMQALADQAGVNGAVMGLAEAVSQTIDALGGDRQWALVGIKSRGDVIAQRLAEAIGTDRFAGRVGALDVTLYRDDLSEVGPQPIVRTTDVSFGIDGLDVVLTDDVLMTGRSVRAALQSLMDLGRPRRVWLAVLVDRGGRELPIVADWVGLDVSADSRLSVADHIQVLLTPTDERDAVLVRAKAATQQEGTTA